MKATSLTQLLAALIISATILTSCASAEDAVGRGADFFAADQYEEAIEEYTDAIEIDPRQAGVYNRRGRAYYEWGRYDNAVADYDKAIAIDPDNVAAYIDRGNAHLANHRSFERGEENYDRALADYEEAISLSPENAVAYYNRGLAFQGKDDYARAIADYDRAIELAPDYTPAHDSRRRAYEQVEQYESALEDYDKAISIQPDSAYLIYGRGLVHLKLGNDAKARRDFLKVMDLGFDKALIESALTNEPISAKYLSYSVEDHRQGVFHHTRGYDRLQQADYDNAVADMDKARKLIDPQLIHLFSADMHEVYFQSGIAYYDTGLYDGAIFLFDKAIDVVLSPSDYPATFYQRGMSHYRKGSYRRAIADFDQIIHLAQDYPDAAHYRQLAHEKLSE